MEEGVKAKGAYAWYLGDLLVALESLFPAKPLSGFASAIGVDLKTLEQYRKVARDYPPADRSPGNSWTVHNVFAPLDDRLGAACEAVLVRRSRAQ